MRKKVIKASKTSIGCWIPEQTIGLIGQKSHNIAGLSRARIQFQFGNDWFVFYLMELNVNSMCAAVGPSLHRM